MPIDNAKRRGRTPDEITAEQRRQAAMQKSMAAPAKPVATPAATVPAKVAASVPAVADTRTPVQAYIDEVAPSTIVGRLIKFGKEGKFITADDDEPIDEATEF